jgi:hypothetical protein
MNVVLVVSFSLFSLYSVLLCIYWASLTCTAYRLGGVVRFAPPFGNRTGYLSSMPGAASLDLSITVGKNLLVGVECQISLFECPARSIVSQRSLPIGRLVCAGPPTYMRL